VSVAGFAGVAWQSAATARQRDIAVLAKEESEAINKFLDSMLGQADPGQAGPDVRVRDFLDAWAERAREELKDKQAIRASVLGTIARTYLNLGLFEKSEELMRDVVPYREQAAEASPREYVRSMVDLATLRFGQERFPEAEEALRRALAFSRERLGARDESTAMVLNSLGPVLRNQKKVDEAETVLKEALEIRRETLGPNHADVAETINNLSFVTYSRGDMAASEELLREALAIREKELPPEHPMCIQALDNLAVVLMRQKKFAEAEPLQAEALARARRRYTPDHPHLALHLNNRATGLNLVKRYDEAIAAYREAVEIRKKHNGELHMETIATAAGLGLTLADAGRFEEGEAVLMEYWDRLQDRKGSREWEHVRVHLEGVYQRWGKSEKREEFRRLKEGQAQG
jgi:tetratricopeptide (TPR) repeat protein